MAKLMALNPRGNAYGSTHNCRANSVPAMQKSHANGIRRIPRSTNIGPYSWLAPVSLITIAPSTTNQITDPIAAPALADRRGLFVASANRGIPCSVQKAKMMTIRGRGVIWTPRVRWANRGKLTTMATRIVDAVSEANLGFRIFQTIWMIKKDWWRGKSMCGVTYPLVTRKLSTAQPL